MFVNAKDARIEGKVRKGRKN